MMKRNEIFRFKKFNVHHSANAQKISTDSVLLGAWANIQNAKKILDIGTGTGVLSLMCAQRNPDVQIIAIEIEETFAAEAKNNFNESIFSDRISLQTGDVKIFSSEKFDHIICNPPYFSNSLKSIDSLKNSARHNLNLDFETLAENCSRLLNSNGLVSLVVPYEIHASVIFIFENNGLNLIRILKIKHNQKMEPSLTLLEFGRKDNEVLKSSELIIKTNDDYSSEYKDLLKEFLIIF